MKNNKIKALAFLFLFKETMNTLETKIYPSFIELCYFYKIKWRKYGYVRYEYITFGREE